MVEQMFLLPRVKGRVIVSNKHGTYELPQELSKNLRPTILKN